MTNERRSRKGLHDRWRQWRIDIRHARYLRSRDEHRRMRAASFPPYEFWRGKPEQIAFPGAFAKWLVGPWPKMLAGGTAIVTVGLILVLLSRPTDTARTIGSALISGCVIGLVFVAVNSVLAEDNERQRHNEAVRLQLSFGQDFAGVDLSGADLRGVYLRHRNLRNAKLRGALLAGADLSESDLKDADLTAADCRGARLEAVDLSSATLIGTWLEGCYLARADLSSACLEDAVLTDALLSEANLTNARLGGASLRGATLWSAKLVGCSWQQTDLTGTDLRTATLTDPIFFEFAIHDSTTKWPDDPIGTSSQNV